MSIIRNDTQVALNDLHVALQRSSDHYLDAAKFLQDEQASEFCRQVAAEREQLINAVEQAVRESGELPSAPDRDREAGEELLERLEGLFSADQTREVLQKRLDTERELRALLAKPDMAVLDEHYADLKQRCRKSVDDVIRALGERIG
ncbi:hypothetical protein AWR36_004800 [Microbulbifer flavimaris]|uniref:DUF2383 domain-containing protein n=1 Tax=Microbulbifer flavimaris TaxID=1781068 RepID=A0ABX4I5M7_9GAMM|nr:MULTISPECIES: hypothetical protein [Microbulbifer]KUJ84950.1 hypothetical protein AVO43_04800 [Microbulbifer sp. ZGT114]PCO07053.1 hypothetical protein AWR36_004800 [Microbulbifer flavimaris]